MTARADVSVWLDEVPTVRAQTLTSLAGSGEPRALVAVDDVLSLFGTAAVLRSTLVAALEALDALGAGQ